MKNKAILLLSAICLIFLFTVSSLAFEQDAYYWLKGKRIPLQINYEQIYVVFTDDVDLSRLSSELRTEIQSLENENNTTNYSKYFRGFK